MTDDQLTAFAERFCAAPLPATVCADACASMPGYPHRTGANLLTVVEAKEVLGHVLASHPTPAGASMPDDAVERMREALPEMLKLAFQSADPDANHKFDWADFGSYKPTDMGQKVVDALAAAFATNAPDAAKREGEA